MLHRSVTSADLVTAIFNGDKSAETALVRKYSSAVRFILEKRCGDPELASDLCQETFLILLGKFRRQLLDEPDKLAAYIQQTAVNLLIADKRKEARRQTSADTELIDKYMDESGSPINHLEKIQTASSVRESILALKNSRDREILYRYYIREYEKSEVCEQLGIDFRHFDKVISRARTRLREAISAPAEPDIQKVAG